MYKWGVHNQFIEGEKREGKKRKGRKERKGKGKKRKRKEERKKGEEGNEEKGRRKGGGPVAPSIFFRRSTDQGASLVHALRGRGFSYTGSFSLKGHQWPYSSVPTLGLSFGIVWDSL